jgi:hypothetical protein
MTRGVVVFSVLALLHGQQPPTFSSDVKVVNVLATVRNKQGKIVQNLTKDDFTLEEDGRPQTIRYFARETDLPLTMGLLVDTSGSQRRVLGAESRASYQFLKQVVREDKDMAFIIHFDREVELLQDLTSFANNCRLRWMGLRDRRRVAEGLAVRVIRVVLEGAGEAAVLCCMTRVCWLRMS